MKESRLGKIFIVKTLSQADSSFSPSLPVGRGRALCRLGLLAWVLPFVLYLSLAVQREIGEYFPSCLFPLPFLHTTLSLDTIESVALSPHEFVYI